MNLRVRSSNRWCVVRRTARPDPVQARRDILAGRNTESGFNILTAPLPPHDDTVFQVTGNDRVLLVAAACYDSVAFLSPRPDKRMTDEVELFLNPANDGLTWHQMRFDPTYPVNETVDNTGHRDAVIPTRLEVISHDPSQAPYSSRWTELRPFRHEWEREEAFSICPIMRERVKWLFAWFRTKDVFGNGPVCGFNLCRYRPYLDEFSSWNYCSGHGSQDATALGRLYLGRAPAALTDVTAELAGGTVLARGRVQGPAAGLRFEVRTPAGDILQPRIRLRAGRWEASFPATQGGRYRLAGRLGSGAVEPDYVSVDVPARKAARAFRTALLYDSCMCLVASPYTPGRLDREMTLWSGLGLQRIHWQDYGRWPSFWSKAVYDWEDHYQATQKACGGDWTRAAIRAAHRHGLEFIGDLKPFDLGFNCHRAPPDGVSTVRTLENTHAPAIPEIAAHPEWTLQANPDWQRPPVFPVAKVCLYSEEPIPRLRVSDIRLLVSRDNRTYRPYRGPVRLRQGVLPRPHERWTPAGPVPERGSRRNWFVELSGLRLTEDYLSLALGSAPWVLRHRGFMAARAWGGSGEPAPLTFATKSTPDQGLYFWKGWQGWANQTEALLAPRSWDGRALGMVFREDDRMQTLLEPAFEGSRRIWLGRVRDVLRKGADGVSIRTYCHHNGPMHYLKFAFAEPVRDTFQSLYGRPPRPGDPADYERVRRIRGDAYTEFMKAGKRLAASMGRTFMAEFETGNEVPAHLNVRMQLALPWERWIREGIVDEIRLKYWAAENPFIHERVLPLARRHGIPVQLISRCLHTGVGIRARELARATFQNACLAGFSGYCLYEQQNLLDRNPEGVPILKGPVAAYLAEARQALEECR